MLINSHFSFHILLFAILWANRMNLFNRIFSHVVQQHTRDDHDNDDLYTNNRVLHAQVQDIQRCLSLFAKMIRDTKNACIDYRLCNKTTIVDQISTSIDETRCLVTLAYKKIQFLHDDTNDNDTPAEKRMRMNVYNVILCKFRDLLIEFQDVQSKWKEIKEQV